MLALLIALLAPSPVDYVRTVVDPTSWSIRVIEPEPLAALSSRAVRFEWKTPPEFEATFTRRVLSKRSVTWRAPRLRGVEVVIRVHGDSARRICPKSEDPRRCMAHLTRPLRLVPEGARLLHDRHVLLGRELLFEHRDRLQYVRLVNRGGWVAPARCAVTLTRESVHLLPALKAACGTLDEVVAQR